MQAFNLTFLVRPNSLTLEGQQVIHSIASADL